LADGVVQGLGDPPRQPILALPPIEVVHPLLPIDARTGEPPHGLTIRLAYAFMLAAAVMQAVGLGLAWWRAIHMDTFDTAVRLLVWTKPVPGSAASIFLAVLLVAVGVVLVAAPAITGYLGWVGRPAALKWAIAALVLTVVTLVITPASWVFTWANIGWLAVPFTLVGVVLLWLPGSRRMLNNWQAFRTPVSAPPPPVRPVVYGRLEQFQ